MVYRTVLSSAFAFAVMLLSATAQAELFRAYLDPSGSDANPCTLPAPCRLLPAALAAVASGGEIWMLDSANYNTGPVTIAKSVTILAVPGALGSVVALNGGPALSIAAGGLNIALRNLVIAPVAGATPGTHGVHMTGASNLTIENSLIAGVPGNGVYVLGTGTLKLAHSTLRGNGGNGGFAILLENGASAAISSTQMLNNTQTGPGNYGGVAAYGNTASTTTAAVSDCVISGGGTGVFAHTTLAGATARVSVTRSTIERMAYALNADTTTGGSAEINVGGSMIVNNDNAFYINGAGAFVRTLGNNQMLGNAGEIGVLTAVAPR